MLFLQGGFFNMGSTVNADTQPIHQVSLSAFYISRYEVTNAGWSEVMGNTKILRAVDQDKPKAGVNFYHAAVYCNKRSIAEGLTPVYAINNQTNPYFWGQVPQSSNMYWNTMGCDWTANGYRLPTEAEWEYAARGCTNSPNYTYAGSMDLYAAGWWSLNSGNATHNVGMKLPNGRELYDMSGNVCEWVWDWYSDVYYTENSTSNPHGAASGLCRVIRGGGFYSYSQDCNVATRSVNSPEYSNSDLGFRVVRRAQ
jgi:formylglycine-generating enzyme required for sulfatase activity